MLCSKCGSEIAENSKFCNNCGASMITDTSQEQELDLFEEEPAKAQVQNKQVTISFNQDEMLYKIYAVVYALFALIFAIRYIYIGFEGISSVMGYFGSYFGFKFRFITVIAGLECIFYGLLLAVGIFIMVKMFFNGKDNIIGYFYISTVAIHILFIMFKFVFTVFEIIMFSGWGMTGKLILSFVVTAIFNMIAIGTFTGIAIIRKQNPLNIVKKLSSSTNIKDIFSNIIKFVVSSKIKIK